MLCLCCMCVCLWLVGPSSAVLVCRHVYTYTQKKITLTCGSGSGVSRQLGVVVARDDDGLVEGVAAVLGGQPDDLSFGVFVYTYECMNINIYK